MTMQNIKVKSNINSEDVQQEVKEQAFYSQYKKIWH